MALKTKEMGSNTFLHLRKLTYFLLFVYLRTFNQQLLRTNSHEPVDDILEANIKIFKVIIYEQNHAKGIYKDLTHFWSHSSFDAQSALIADL